MSNGNPSALVILWALGLMIPIWFGLNSASHDLVVPVLIYFGLTAVAAVINYRLKHS